MPCLLGPVALAGRISLPALRRRHRMAGSNGALAMRRVRPTDVGDRGHLVSRHADAADDVVSSDVVRHQLQDGHQRAGAAAGVGPGELSHRLDVAAQVCGQTLRLAIFSHKFDGRPL